jgi:hypothetical protein
VAQKGVGRRSGDLSVGAPRGEEAKE